MKADPLLAMRLLKAGKPLRTGRSVGRTIYVQQSEYPDKGDLLIGMMDSKEIADWIVLRFNKDQVL